MQVVIDVEGVLAEEGQLPPRASQSLYGTLLYQHMRGNKVALHLLSESRSERLMKEWLLREGYGDYVQLTCRASSLLEPPEWRVASLKKMVAQGHHISFYMGADPSISAEVAALGVTYLLVIPGTGKPGKGQRDIPYRQWDHLTSIMDDKKLREAQLAEEVRKQDEKVSD